MSQQINFLDPSLLPQRRWLTAHRVFAIAAVLGAGLAAQGAHEAWAYKRLSAVSANSASSSMAAADLAAQPSAADELTQKLLAQEQQLARDRSLLNAVAGMSDLPRHNARRLQALVAALPDNAWLSEVEFTGAQGLRVVGGALAPAALAAYSRRLGATPDFQGLPLQTFAMTSSDPAQPDEARPEPGAEQASAPPRSAAPQAPLFGFVLSSGDAALAANLSTGLTP